MKAKLLGVAALLSVGVMGTAANATAISLDFENGIDFGLGQSPHL